MPEECPFCHSDMQYEPGNDQGLVGSRLIGMEIQGVYDGMLYWICPDCDVAYQRFSDPGMRAKAQPFIDQHNESMLKRRA